MDSDSSTDGTSNIDNVEPAKNWTSIPARAVVRSILDKTLQLARMTDAELTECLDTLTMIERSMPAPATDNLFAHGTGM